MIKRKQKLTPVNKFIMKLTKLVGFIKKGEIAPVENQATEILPKISAICFRWSLFNFTNNTIK